MELVDEKLDNTKLSQDKEKEIYHKKNLEEQLNIKISDKNNFQKIYDWLYSVKELQVNN